MFKILNFTFFFVYLNSNLSFSSEPVEPSTKNSLELTQFFDTLLIPASEGYTNPDWKSLSTKLNVVSWVTEEIVEASEFDKKLGSFYFREGRIVFKNNGVPTHEVLGKVPQLGQWSVELFGARSFVNEVSIKMLNNTQGYNLDIAGILKRNSYSIATYKCSIETEPASSGNVVYAIEHKSFKPAWLKYEWSCGSGGCAAYITLYYSKDRAERTECYGY